VLVVSHDEAFLERIGVTRVLTVTAGVVHEPQPGAPTVGQTKGRSSGTSGNAGPSWPGSMRASDERWLR